MVCIYCKSETIVVNSRPKKKDFSIWRRRKCLKCGSILTSFEKYEYSSALMVRKRSGGLEGFQRDKLIISVARAIDHKNNSSQAASFLTENIIKNILNQEPLPKIIFTQNISEMTSLVLKRYDAVSAIKYQSYKFPTQGKRDINKML